MADTDAPDDVEKKPDEERGQYVDQEASEFAADGRPMFQGELVAFFQGEPGRIILVMYGTGLVMAIPLNIKGAQIVKDALDTFLTSPLSFPQMGPKGVIQ